jgi:hypothetical protein
MLTIGNMAMLRNIEVMPHKVLEVGICINVNCAQKSVTKLFFINLQFLLASAYIQNHIKETVRSKYFSQLIAIK